jgi:DNA-binding transcriptional regulator YhcF (GntR family)
VYSFVLADLSRPCEPVRPAWLAGANVLGFQNYVLSLDCYLSTLGIIHSTVRARNGIRRAGRGGQVAPAFENLTLWERVYDHLRDEIMGDRLPPGTELSEVALSKELAVSRGPIREAMGRLAAEGLVTVRPRRGAEVRAITPAELIDSYQVREALEVLAVRLAVHRISDAELADLDELVD